MTTREFFDIVRAVEDLGLTATENGFYNHEGSCVWSRRTTVAFHDSDCAMVTVMHNAFQCDCDGNESRCYLEAEMPTTALVQYLKEQCGYRSRKEADAERKARRQRMAARKAMR